MTTTWGVRGQVVTPETVVDDGVVLVEGERIAWVGPAAAVPPEWAGTVAGLPPAEPGTTVLPGLVDIHDHGGGGSSFPDATDLDTARRAAVEHAGHGTTTLVASLVTAPRAVLLQRAELLADLVAEGWLAGIHLEGPFLSEARCGAQNPADMIPGDPGLVRELDRVSRGAVVSMTIAPEVPGVADGGPGREDVVAALAGVGALPSIGHTDATYAQVEAAIAHSRAALAAAGRPELRPTATHLFNGMRPMHHRDPGPVAASLAGAARGDLVVELIADGVHLSLDTVRAVIDIAGEHAIFVTDAMAAAGMADGDYRLGPMAVRVGGGVARLISPDGSDGAIAGGTSHLLDQVRGVVAAGVDLATAVRLASLLPARALGREDVGALAVGRRADLVVTDGDLRVREVRLTGGREV